jgi:hypothetical protein
MTVVDRRAVRVLLDRRHFRELVAGKATRWVDPDSPAISIELVLIDPSLPELVRALADATATENQLHLPPDPPEAVELHRPPRNRKSQR